MKAGQKTKNKEDEEEEEAEVVGEEEEMLQRQQLLLAVAHLDQGQLTKFFGYLNQYVAI